MAGYGPASKVMGTAVCVRKLPLWDTTIMAQRRRRFARVRRFLAQRSTIPASVQRLSTIVSRPAQTLIQCSIAFLCLVLRADRLRFPTGDEIAGAWQFRAIGCDVMRQGPVRGRVDRLAARLAPGGRACPVCGGWPGLRPGKDCRLVVVLPNEGPDEPAAPETCSLCGRALLVRLALPGGEVAHG